MNAAGTITVNARGEILVLLNRKGYATLPAGKVEPGEGHKAAAVRETREETGIDVETFGAPFVDWRGNEAIVIYKAVPVSGNLTGSHEGEPAYILPSEIRWDSSHRRTNTAVLAHFGI